MTTSRRRKIRNALPSCSFRLSAIDGSFTAKDLQKQSPPQIVKQHTWVWPYLKFVAYREGLLQLLNTHKNQSYHLFLQVQDHTMTASCSCGIQQANVCPHIYGALSYMICIHGEYYFKSLRPGGPMALAFRHPRHFDKEETTGGLSITPRPELKTVFGLHNKELQLPPILRQPCMMDTPPAATNHEACLYLLMLPSRNKWLPFVLPCMGTLNKAKKDIKTFHRFLHGLQKDRQLGVTGCQQQLNASCLELFKMVEQFPEPVPGILNEENGWKKLFPVFTLWQQMFTALKNHPFVYAYRLYGLRELKNRPAKKRILKLHLNPATPSLRFLLTVGNAYARLELQVWINGILHTATDAGTTFFVVGQQQIYLLSSLRDALVAAWMRRSGGAITIFNEHYQQFEKTILQPLQHYYPVEIKTNKKA